jgi:hypothetical protein
MIVTGDQDVVCTSAMPPLDVRGPVAVVPIAGGADWLTETALELLCFRLARDPEIRTVVVSIDSQVSICNPADLLAPVERLARQKPLFAYVDVALGASFILALPARAICSGPRARVGKLGIANERWEPAERELVDSLNEEIVATVRRYRPGAEARIVRRLLRQEIRSGEVLEHFGLVDFVMNQSRLIGALGGTEQ